MNVYRPAPVRGGGDENSSIAIHVHVFYVDVWKKYLEYLKALDFRYALFITTSSDSKAEEIRALLPRAASAAEVREVIVIENRGRDILPWIAISEKLSNYDFVLHAHTKRSPTVADWVGASWQQDIFDALLLQAGKIIRSFQENPALGIVIPDIPRFWRYIAPVRRETEAPFIGMMNDLWSRLRCEKKVDFESASAFVMPYGTMFWYRPNALAKISSLSLSVEEVPIEPLPERSVLHALERLMVYVAWDAGFDYKIVPPKEIALGFIDGIVRNRQFVHQPSAEVISVQNPAVLVQGEGNKKMEFSFIRRVVAKLRILARPKKLIK